jgi:hypothetical protein
MRHHTKDKGDQGLGFVIADLLRAGIQVALPLSEHLPFDAIAIAENGRMSRIQVKYRAATRGEVIYCQVFSSWADRNGSHDTHFDPNGCDALAVYCPEPAMCCYLRSSELQVRAALTLRIAPPRNGQTRGVRMAVDYLDRCASSSAISSVG